MTAKANYTAAERLETTRLARRLWLERVANDDVVPRLGNWRCGTQACFGGHLIQWPEFKAYGVYSYDSAPAMQGKDFFVTIPSVVSQILFGHAGLFSSRTNHPADWQDGSELLNDHQIVTQRLDWLERYLESQL